MQSFSDVVDAFGGVSDFARAHGKTRYWAKKVKERDNLNGAHFAATAQLAAERGIPITLETLAEIAARK